MSRKIEFDKISSDTEPFAGNSNARTLSFQSISKEEREKNFKEWFGDSKVVDVNGEPLVVYHGTGASFDVFDKSKIGSNYKADKYNVTLSKQERKMMEVWNKLDPVDEWERIKNKRVFRIQGNLNKYIN